MRFFLLSLLLVNGFFLTAQVVLDPRYHTNEEIYEFLLEKQTEYPDLVQMVQIGTTMTDELPVWAIKMTNNVSERRDIPAVLYLGQVHAEEVLGVEITLWMINEILQNRFITPYSIWLQYIEIWFVPTYNPEGLQVVMDGWDTSWRKNKRDNNNNGIFDYVPGPGNDIDGVDLNRNYGFNWVHGDSLYAPGSQELYDYYRGPAPNSEHEVQAIQNLAAERHFIYSIAWHSSRTGNLSEKVFYSFEFEGEKRCPDFALTQSIGQSVASLIIREDGTGSYEPSPSRGRKGSAHDWFYKEHGTIQLLIECGTSNLQPAAPIVDDTCTRNKTGAYWLLNRVLGYQTSAAMLTGHITDAVTGEPLVAEIIIEERQASYFTPRYSDSAFGRYWRPLLPGTYTIHVKKQGYEPATLTNVTVNNSLWTQRSFQLNPLTAFEITGNVTANGEPVNGAIYIEGDYPEIMEFANGTFSFTGYEGLLEFWIVCEGSVPVFCSEEISAENFSFNYSLDSEHILFQDFFENGLGNWQINGTWELNNDAQTGNYALRSAMGTFYENNENKFTSTQQAILIPNVQEKTVLSFWQKYHTEHDFDIASVQISANGTDWLILRFYSGQKDYWHKEIISLADFGGESIYLRFHFASDGTETDPGWWIDDIRIVSTGSSDMENSLVPEMMTQLFDNYPNPFNPTTTISFNIAEKGNTELSVFNVKGQKVITLFTNDNQLPGHYKITWNGLDSTGSKVSSGLYFYQLVTEKHTKTKKMLLLK
jgi:hypothetical protein